MTIVMHEAPESGNFAEHTGMDIKSMVEVIRYTLFLHCR